MNGSFWGIGEASAAVVMAVLGANPALAVFSSGFLGRVVFFILKIFFAFLAKLGLIVLNVGAAKLQTVIAAGDFDGSWETAEQIISGIRSTGRDLTPDEITTIDQPVIDAFRKFASFGRAKNNGTPTST